MWGLAGPDDVGVVELLLDRHLARGPGTWADTGNFANLTQATNAIRFDKPGPSAIFQRRSGVFMEVAC